jgi:hypothetical protein
MWTTSPGFGNETFRKLLNNFKINSVHEHTKHTSSHTPWECFSCDVLVLAYVRTCGLTCAYAHLQDIYTHQSTVTSCIFFEPIFLIWLKTGCKSIILCGGRRVRYACLRQCQLFMKCMSPVSCFSLYL